MRIEPQALMLQQKMPPTTTMRQNRILRAPLRTPPHVAKCLRLFMAVLLLSCCVKPLAYAQTAFTADSISYVIDTSLADGSLFELRGADNSVSWDFHDGHAAVVGNPVRYKLASPTTSLTVTATPQSGNAVSFPTLVNTACGPQIMWNNISVSRLKSIYGVSPNGQLTLNTPGNPLVPMWVGGQVFIHGTLDVDYPFGFYGTPNTAMNVLCDRDAKIVCNTSYTQVLPTSSNYNSFTLDHATLSSCGGYMWTGIIANNCVGRICTKNNSTIRDAHRALDVQTGGLDATMTNFFDNEVGIFFYTSGLICHPNYYRLQACSFRTVSNYVKLTSNLPNTQRRVKGWVGLYLNSLPISSPYLPVNGTPVLADNCTFDNLFIGIYYRDPAALGSLAVPTNPRITECTFSNIWDKKTSRMFPQPLLDLPAPNPTAPIGITNPAYTAGAQSAFNPINASTPYGLPAVQLYQTGGYAIKFVRDNMGQGNQQCERMSLEVDGCTFDYCYRGIDLLNSHGANIHDNTFNNLEMCVFDHGFEYELQNSGIRYPHVWQGLSPSLHITGNTVTNTAAFAQFWVNQNANSTQLNDAFLYLVGHNEGVEIRDNYIKSKNARFHVEQRWIEPIVISGNTVEITGQQNDCIAVHEAIYTTTYYNGHVYTNNTLWSATPYATFAGTPPGQMWIENNTVHRAQVGGIYAYGVSEGRVFNNTIDLLPSSSTQLPFGCPGIRTSASVGINSLFCDQFNISDNKITGTNPVDHLQIGINVAFAPLSIVQCNNVTSCGKAIRLNGSKGLFVYSNAIHDCLRGIFIDKPFLGAVQSMGWHVSSSYFQTSDNSWDYSGYFAFVLANFNQPNLHSRVSTINLFVPSVIPFAQYAPAEYQITSAQSIVDPLSPIGTAVVPIVEQTARIAACLPHGQAPPIPFIAGPSTAPPAQWINAADLGEAKLAFDRQRPSGNPLISNYASELLQTYMREPAVLDSVKDGRAQRDSLLLTNIGLLYAATQQLERNDSAATFQILSTLVNPNAAERAKALLLTIRAKSVSGMALLPGDSMALKHLGEQSEGYFGSSVQEAQSLYRHFVDYEYVFGTDTTVNYRSTASRHVSKYGLLAIYPNPSEGSSNALFELPTGQTATLSLTDVSGRCIWQAHVASTGTIALPQAVSAGVYHISLQSESGVSSLPYIVTP